MEESTLEERFHEEFVREDGLLDIGKYDSDRVINHIYKEIHLDRATRDKELREKIKGMKKVPNPNKSLKQYVVGSIDGHNNAMDEVLALLAESSK